MIVLDTNVLVSGLLSPDGAPAQLLRLITGSRERIAYDQRIISEYRTVLERPRFKIASDEIDQIIEAIEQDGRSIVAGPLNLSLPDTADLPFIEVAVSAGRLPLVTGNLRHFTKVAIHPIHIEVYSPADWLAKLSRRRT